MLPRSTDDRSRLLVATGLGSLATSCFLGVMAEDGILALACSILVGVLALAIANLIEWVADRL